MRSRKFFAFFPLVCLLVSVLVPLGNVSSAEGITALNVAVPPPFNSDKYTDADAALVEKIQAKIVRHFRYPYYEVITATKEKDKGFALASAALKDKKKPYDEDIMRDIAQKMSADIVVMAELAKVRWHIYQSMWPGGDTYEQIDVVLNCYTYSAKDGKYDKVKVSAYHYDVVGFRGGLDTVVSNLTDEMLAKIPYKTIIKEE